MHSLTGAINSKGDVGSCDSKVLERTYRTTTESGID